AKNTSKLYPYLTTWFHFLEGVLICLTLRGQSHYASVVFSRSIFSSSAVITNIVYYVDQKLKKVNE
ncbi:hypothetical protein, partial [Paenibacillus turicensis]|uniref:hypothetical protein n=1 Tax=Paenibacillus turicensis TaxID=160487 RepID=UPI001AEB527F